MEIILKHSSFLGCAEPQNMTSLSRIRIDSIIYASRNSISYWKNRQALNNKEFLQGNVMYTCGHLIYEKGNTVPQWGKDAIFS